MAKRGGLLVAGALAGVLAAGPAAAQDVKIGGLLPLTGDLQAYGGTSKQGIQLAVQEINAAGGVLGEDLEATFADTKTTPQAGVDAANKLVSINNVAGIVGALSSGVTISVARAVTSQKGVPQISNASTSPKITTLDDNGYLFRTVPSDALQGQALSDVVFEEGYRTVSTLYVNNAYGEGLASTFRERFEARGGTVAASLPYEKGKASYRGELAEASGDGAEALVLIGYPQNGTTILRQALQQQHFDQFAFTDGMKAPEVPEQLGGSYLDGSVGTVPAAPQNDAARTFEEAFKAEHGELPPKPFIDTAYDATYLLALAMQKAGSTDRQAVRDALHDVANPPGTEVGPGEWKTARQALKNGDRINYEGAAGSVDFTENGDVPGIFKQWTFEGTSVKTVDTIEPEM
mgnify:CR=1 FL=1